jgi:hypothetical protein
MAVSRTAIFFFTSLLVQTLDALHNVCARERALAVTAKDKAVAS